MLIPERLFGTKRILLCLITAVLMPAPAGPKNSSFTPPPDSAKSVIQVWLWGGPSHLDTFDPKPGAGYDYCGPFMETASTNVPGIEINAMLPKLAGHADKYSIIRGMTHGINAHETAAYIMQTGHSPGGSLVYPSIGAVVSFFKRHDSPAGGIPPYVILTSSQGRFSEVGFLPSEYRPFITGGNPAHERFAVEGISPPAGISPERQDRRREILSSLDTLGNVLGGARASEAFDLARLEAFEFMRGEAAEVFDLSGEPDEIRDFYGRNHFGQSCLAARRLVEKGVPYVTVNYGGWDTHSNHFEAMRLKLPELDAGLSALLEDLSARGLLESTIVWVGGEFGRTPRIYWEPPWNGGRGHYGKCFSVILAGGGFKGGGVVGATDSRGEEVTARPVSPRNLLASIYTRLGISPDSLIPVKPGLKTLILPPYPDGLCEGVLREIMICAQ